MTAARPDRPGSTITLVDTNGNHLDFTRLPLRASPGDEAGLYAFAGRDAGPKRSGLMGWLTRLLATGKDRPVFIGEADSLMTRLERHDLLDDARAMGATALWIHFTPKTDEPDRKRMVQSLVKAYQPPLNRPRYDKIGESASPRALAAVKALEAPKQPAAAEQPQPAAYRRRDRLLQGRGAGSPGSGDQTALPAPE
jgi:hypothetical protein